MRMFDIGFWEIILLCIVLLIVVGPERLPALARTAGLWIGKARRIVSEVKTEVERELRVEELKQSIDRQTHADEFKHLAERVKSINSDLKHIDSDLKSQRVDKARSTETGSAEPPADSASTSRPPTK